MLHVEAAVPLDEVIVAWPTLSLWQEGDAELDIVADLLNDYYLPGSVRGTKPLAAEVRARQHSWRDASMFTIGAKVTRGVSPYAVLAAIDRALGQLSATQPSQFALDSASHHFLTHLLGLSKSCSGCVRAKGRSGSSTGTGWPVGQREGGR